MTLDIAQYIGTQPLPYGKANGRTMTTTVTGVTTLYYDDDAATAAMMAVTEDGTLNLAALAKAVRDLQNLTHGLQAEIVSLRQEQKLSDERITQLEGASFAQMQYIEKLEKKLEAWEGDS
jgi:hypothetical protein